LKILKTKSTTLSDDLYFCVKFQKVPLYGVNLSHFAPWLPWQRKKKKKWKKRRKKNEKKD
jgi:hypothetical protein